jgi:rhodanese-related sulfurtransferase
VKYLIFVLIILSNCAVAQEQEDTVKQKAFYALINSLIDHSVEEVKPRDIEMADQIWLDAREVGEFKISRIENARFVGYDKFDISTLDDLDKDAEIIVYCSIGYRSEKVAEKMKAAGFTNVKNLYGGIFDWYNQGKQVVDKNGAETNKVHGYSRTWGIWLNDAKTVY